MAAALGSTQVAATPPDPSVMANSLLTLYNSRLSKDNAIRMDAEANLTQLQRQDPDSYCLGTLILLRQNPDDDVRQQAAIHIKLLLKESSVAQMMAGVSNATGGSPGTADAAAAATDSKAYWARLSEPTRQSLKSELIATLESEEFSSKVRNAVCDGIAILGSTLLADGGWPELQPKIFSLLSSPSPNCQISGLQVLSNLVSDLSEVIGKNIGAVQEVLRKLFASESADVRFECVSLISAVVESEKRGVWKHLQCCIPNALQSLALAVQDPRGEEQATKLLIVLIEIAEYDAGFFSTHLTDLTNALFAIARNAAQHDRVRQLALELLLTMVEGKPKMCKKATGLIDELLKVLMEFMVTIEDDPEWVNKQNEDDNEDEDDTEESTNYQIAEGGLDRLAADAGGEVVLPKLFVLVGQYLSQPVWTMKYAALMAVSQTVEHIPEAEIVKYLDQIVPICLAQLQDPHPRVRYAALQALGQAATDTQPLLQEQYIQAIMPHMIQALEDPVIRLQTQASRALSNFCEEVKPEDLAPYTDSLVDQLLQRVTLQTDKPLLSSCITTLAVVAASADTYFTKHYSKVVPAMKEIVSNLPGPTHRSYRENALECITLVALSIGREAFAGDIADCMRVIVQLWTEAVDGQLNSPGGTTGEGPSETLNESLCRMCRVLEADFVQYLPHILPQLFRLLDQKPQATDLEELAVNKEEICLVGMENGKTTAMKTQMVLELEQMTTILLTFVAALGKHFQEWIVQTVQSTIPLLEFQYCEKVLQNALNILAETLKVARTLADAETVDLKKTAYMHLISQWLLTGVDKAISVIEDDQILVDLTSEVPKSAATLLKNAGSNMLNAEQVYNLSKKTLELLDLSCTRNEDIVKGKQEEHDEDDEDNIEGEQRFELELAASMVDILSAIIEHHRETFSQVALPLAMEFIRTRFQSATSPQHALSGGGLPLTLAIYVLCEIIGMGEATSEYWAGYIPSLLEALNSSDPVVRQPAAHGLKLIAKTTSRVMNTEDVAKVTRTLLTALDKSDRLPQPLEESDQGALDNVVSAIGALVFQQSAHLIGSGDASLSPARLLSIWFAHLPLKFDDGEGQLVHLDLVKLVLAKNETIWSNLPHLIKSFAKIYKTPFSTSEINGAVIQAMLEIGKTIGEAPLTELLSQLDLDKDSRKNLEQIIADARQLPQQTAAA